MKETGHNKVNDRAEEHPQNGSIGHDNRRRIIMFYGPHEIQEANQSLAVLPHVSAQI